MAKIAKFLYESHVKTKKLKDGQPNYNWSQISVGRILTNPIYIGTVINGKESMKDIFTSQRQKNPKEEWYVSERQARSRAARGGWICRVHGDRGHRRPR